MNWDDIIYVSLLLGCIGFGYFYRRMEKKNVAHKKWIGSGIGIALILIVSGIHILHIAFTFLASFMIMKLTSVRKAHLITFVFLFTYLLFFRLTKRFGIPEPPGHTNLVQMMLVLKIVGLAFERNTASKDIKVEKEKSTNTPAEKNVSQMKLAYMEDILQMDLLETFHYCFNYIGVLTGPYFTYRTFRDYFCADYWEHVHCEKVLLHRLKWILVYVACFLVCSYIWPISYAKSDEFYNERSFIYRLWYVWPSFLNFRLRIYIGLALSECVCIMAGFGAYPTAFRSRPGGGPRDLVALEKPLHESDYDFETIHNIDAEGTEKCWTFKEGMRHYNMCIQYWMATVVYQRFPNRQFRTFATLAVSSYWHGVHSGYYLCMMGAPVYLPIEALWDKLIRQKAEGTVRRVLDVVFWVSKFFTFSYLGMAFLLMSIDKIWFYYNSVYHFGYILWAVMYAAGLLLAKKQAKERKRKERASEKGEATVGEELKTKAQ